MDTQMTWEPALVAPGSLADNALTTLRAFFDQQRHYPSEEHWEALRDVAETMDRMANGTCSPKVFLSSIDCGVGKTQTVVHFARALVASPDHDDVGMLVCVGRIAEAEALGKALDVIRQHVAVLTSDPVANALSGTDPDNAQVLITTQQRIERATDGRAFGDTMTFHYRGAVRAVRVWDESWLPGAAITLGADDIGFMPKLVRPFSAECATALKRFGLELDDVGDGDVVNVPDFEAYGISWHDVDASAAGSSGLRDDQKAAVIAMRLLNGHTVRARKDGPRGPTILTYHDTLPNDLTPLLVLDASGRVRKTYAWIERHRGDLVRLRSAVKDYSPLAVHIWSTSGGKSGLQQNGGNLVKGIIATILTKPRESWLVVVHKPSGRLTSTEKAIRTALPSDVNDNVAVITWGSHMATNDHAEVSNVILAGTLFMRPSHYTALTHLAQDRDVVPGLASKAEIDETMRGEHAHVVLQAICRGRVRRSNGSQCHQMTAYVIASQKSGIPQDLTTIFPGCTVKPWNPLKPILKGKLKAAVGLVDDDLTRGEEWISIASIRDRLKMSAQDFRRRVSNLPAWKQFIIDRGLITTRGPRGAKGLTRGQNIIPL